MINYDLMFHELKRNAHIFVHVSDTDDLHIQVATKEMVAIESEVPVNVEADPRDLILALPAFHLEALRALKVKIPRSACVFHENQYFVVHPMREAETKKAERDVHFTESFRDALLDHLCIE